MSIVRGNYQNVASYSLGAIISSKNDGLQGFYRGNDGSCSRDTIYINFIDQGFTWSGPGISINILLMQKYLLNTLKIWLWDRGSLYEENDRFYKIIVYAKLGLIENKIYESDVATSLIKIKFPDQFVQEFRVQGLFNQSIKSYILSILNVGGNTDKPFKSIYTYNVGLHQLKLKLYYKVNMKYELNCFKIKLNGNYMTKIFTLLIYIQLPKKEVFACLLVEKTFQSAFLFKKVYFIFQSVQCLLVSNINTIENYYSENQLDKSDGI